MLILLTGGDEAMRTKKKDSLLEFMAVQAGCAYLSDLPRISGRQRAKARQALEQLPPEAATLQEWNDALDYLIHAPPEETAQAARERLLSALARP